jgi:hypothetical protein
MTKDDIGEQQSNLSAAHKEVSEMPVNYLIKQLLT